MTLESLSEGFAPSSQSFRRALDGGGGGGGAGEGGERGGWERFRLGGVGVHPTLPPVSLLYNQNPHFTTRKLFRNPHFATGCESFVSHAQPAKRSSVLSQCIDDMSWIRAHVSSYNHDTVMSQELCE